MQRSDEHKYYKKLHFDIDSDHISKPYHMFLWGSSVSKDTYKLYYGGSKRRSSYREVDYSKYNPVVWTITDDYPISLTASNFEYAIDVIKTVIVKIIKATYDLRVKGYLQKTNPCLDSIKGHFNNNGILESKLMNTGFLLQPENRHNEEVILVQDNCSISTILYQLLIKNLNNKNDTKSEISKKDPKEALEFMEYCYEKRQNMFIWKYLKSY